MLTNDFIVEQSRMVIRMLKTVLIAPDGGMIDDVDTIKFYDELLDAQENIKSLLEKSEFGKAEDIVFDLLDEDSKDKNICLALWFYNKLLDYDENTLEENDFEKDEILDGLKELEGIKLPQ